MVGVDFSLTLLEIADIKKHEVTPLPASKLWAFMRGDKNPPNDGSWL